MKNYKIIEIEYWNSQKGVRDTKCIIKKKYWFGWFYIRLGLNLLLFNSAINAKSYIYREIKSKIKPIKKEIDYENLGF